MATGKKAGKAAGKTLQSKSEDKKAKAAAGSALAQRPKSPAKKK
jgi:hypothetical protein